VIAIVDYGAGNLRSVKKALDYLGLESEITRDPEAVRNARKIILPGVGHFVATARLATSGLRDAISDIVRQGTPFLGICVGMQWLYSGSEESPETPGLGLFTGSCARFPTGIKVPHVGWNSLQMSGESRLLQGVKAESFVYFTHSYRAPIGEGTVAITEYESPFASAVERDNVFGVQFHPEKSGDEGLKMLKNFGDLKC
jgi:imidazole glycerol-phosphate synthase subunit HisH